MATILLTLSAVGLRLLHPTAASHGSTNRAGRVTCSASYSKGLTHAALVELGSGCCHYNNSTKAAIRACNNAVEWNSVKVRTIIPGSYDAMRVHVHLAVPDPENIDLDAIASCFPYGTLLPIKVERGGMLGSSRTGLPEDEPTEALMTVACACVTIGWGNPEENLIDATAEADVPPPPPLPPPPMAPPPEPSAVATPAVAGTGRGVPPTLAEMTPRSAEMLARASAAQAKWADRVLTPMEAFAMLGDEDDIEVCDVRTTEQRETHTVNGVEGVSVMGARSLPLDDLVSGAAELPPADQPLILVCSRGPKSLVALDYLAEACPRAVCVEGGVEAWDAAKLPTEEVGRKAVVEWVAEMAREARERRARKASE